jgi:hypothetical protein
METTLTREAKIQLASSLRRRYQTASSRTKKQILSEFVAVSGYHPKYAVHLLNAAEPSAPARRGRVRPTLYDDAAKQALIVMWEASDRVCGKRLKPLLRILLPSLERHGHLKLDEVIRAKLLAMSAATIDRLLRVAREKIDIPTQEPNLAEFLASLSGAWRAGEIRPTHRMESKPRYLRQIQTVVRRDAGTARQIDPPRPPCVAPITPKPEAIETKPPMPQLNPQIEKQCEIVSGPPGTG